MFRNAKPSPTELVLTRNALSLATGSLIYMIEGNHDLPRHTGECSALMPLTGGEVGICSAPEVWDVRDYQVAFLPYPNRARLAEVFVDYAHLSPEESDRLVSAHVETILRGLAAQLDSTRPSLLLAHISIDAAEAGAEGSIMAGRDITIPLSAVPEEFTFAAFGHIHKPQDFSAYGRPNVFYTGSTDRIDFGEEGEEKSYVMIDFEERSWSRIPIPCRKYKTVEFWAMEDGRDAWADLPSLEVQDAITRVAITRPDSYKPDYQALQNEVENAGCFDFRGFVEDVKRVAAVRSGEIVEAESLSDLVRVWADSKSYDGDVEELVALAQALERTLA